MAAIIDWTIVERSQNRAGQIVAHRNFGISSHDGHVSGRIIVPDGPDRLVIKQTEERLKLLLKDALAELDGK